jgi:hypothetical protein
LGITMQPYQTFDPQETCNHARIPIQDTISDSHLRAIGLLVTQWSYTERVLACAIIDLQHMESGKYIKDDTYLLPVIAMGAKAIIGVLKAAFKLRFKETADFGKILDRIQDILEIRDLLSHSNWKPTEKKGILETFLVKNMNEARVKRKQYSASGIFLEAYKLQLITVELIRFMNDRALLLEYGPSWKPEESKPQGRY